MLVRHGANITARDTMNDTPLHRTCRRGHPGITDFLLRCGSATRGCFNSTGEEPLTLAVRYNRSAQAIQMLRDRETMRDAVAGRDMAHLREALEFGEMRGDVELFHVVTGRTALLDAAEDGWVEGVRYVRAPPGHRHDTAV